MITIYELLEKLGKFHFIEEKSTLSKKSKSITHGYYVVELITDQEIELLKEYLKFDSFHIESINYGGNNEMRFHIAKGDNKK